MNNSILTDIKKMLGITEEYEVYDLDVIILINTTIADLTTITDKINKDFQVIDKSNTWEELCPYKNTVDLIKTYIYLSVKQIFDPSNASSSIDELKNKIEWKINWKHELGEED